MPLVTPRSLRRRARSGRRGLRRPLRPCLEHLESRLPLAAFVVNSVLDLSDSGAAPGVCDTALVPDVHPPSGICTLRAAVESSNETPESDTITFAIPAGSEILTTGFDLTSQVTITGPAGRVLITNSADRFGSRGISVTETAGGTEIRNLGINGFGTAIRLLLSDGNVVAGNLIGVDAAGTVAVGNDIGISIEGNDNVVGGTSEADRNVISGNGTGIVIVHHGSAGQPRSNNRVQGNFIGTDITGSAAIGNTSAGVRLTTQAQDNVIGGPEAAGNLISGNYYGVLIDGNTATGNYVVGNRIGTDAAGLAALGNVEGVHINQSPGNFIGGTLPGSSDVLGNVIADSRADVAAGVFGAGVFLGGSGATENLVQGNRIGTNLTGSAAIPNAGSGVMVNQSSSNIIGGLTAEQRNVISGNTGDGITILGTPVAPARDNVVVGNYIGTDATGMTALGNGFRGVHIDQHATGTVVGGATAEARNVISGNQRDGVIIALATASGSRILGNYIGTDKDGTGALANQRNGVFVLNAPDNEIGGTSPGEGNLISANQLSGVRIQGIEAAPGNTASGNRVQGNRIGTAVNGADLLGNGELGVRIVDATGTLVGGNAACDANSGELPGNLIAGHPLGGVWIEGEPASGNTVRCNSIFGNSGLGIDLDGDGVSPNDPQDADAGPNGAQNFPNLALVEAIEGTILVGGTLSSQATTVFRVDFYATDVTAATRLEHGLQGQRYLGSTDVTTDATGYGHFEVRLPELNDNEVVNATATDPLGNTSEFSPFAPDLKGQGSFEVRTPVLVIPGFFGSFPRDVPGSGSDSAYKEWLLQLGIEPNKLALDPVARVYKDIVTTLEIADYVQGRDLFVAPFDWRLPIAPTPSGAPDGLLEEVTAQSITDDKFEYGVDYLGYWLKQAAESWYERYQQPLTSVHIIAHSMGGVLSRSYMQSPAYGAAFSSTVRPDGDLVLPQVSSFTMLGVPHQGGAGTLTAWHDNFGANTAYRLVLSKVINHAWHKLQQGAIIDGGVHHTIHKSDFAGMDERTAKVEFVRQYVKGLGNLLPTYPGFAVEFDPQVETAAQNPLLEDLNHDVLFPSRVARSVVIFGTSLTTTTQVEQMFGPLPTPWLTLTGPTPLISFTEIDGHNAAADEFWYRDINEPASGDGTVSLQSLRGLFENDPRVELHPYCDPTLAACRLGEHIADSREKVSHTSLVSNRRVQQQILVDILRHRPDFYSTGSEVADLWTGVVDIAIPFVSYNLTSDLVSPLFVDAEGRQTGFSQATGRVAQIPGSVYFGDEDGIGWIFQEPGSGPVTLRLTGLGEDHYVQSTVYDGTVAAGIESLGVLAIGETRELAVPVPRQIFRTALVVGPEDDDVAPVRVFQVEDPSIVGQFDFFPFGIEHGGGVRVAVGDVDGDGVSDVITGAGGGAAGGHVKVFSGQTGVELQSFFAFPGFLGGVHVAAGDVNGDGRDDVIVGTGPGAAGGHVRVFSGQDGAELQSFFAFPGFSGGVRVAAGDVNGDGRDDIIVGAGPGAAGGQVKVFSGVTGAELHSFFAFPGFSGGVYVAAGDVEGDGRADIVVGAATDSAGARVKVFSGQLGVELGVFSPFSGPADSVHVAAGDVNGDGRDDIIVGLGGGESGGQLLALRSLDGNDIFTIRAFDENLLGGVAVGALTATAPTSLDLPSTGGAFEVLVDDYLIVRLVEGDEILRGRQIDHPRVRIHGEDDADDRLTAHLDSLSAALIFDGGVGGQDVLRLEGVVPFPFLEYRFLGRAGGLVFDEPLGRAANFLTFYELEQMEDDLTVVDRVFSFPDANNQVIVSAVEDGDTTLLRIASPNQGTVEFRPPSGTLTLFGGSGDDSFQVDFSPLPRIDGQGGYNELVVPGAGRTLDLTQIPPADLLRIDAIHVAGTGPNRLILDVNEVLTLAPASGALTVHADFDDTIQIGPGWSFQGTEVVDGLFVRVLGQGAARLRMIGPRDWTNPINRLDVNANGTVEPLDVINVVNELNGNQYHGPDGRLLNAAGLDAFPGFFYDVQSDGFVVPLDALAIINFLNAVVGSSEGETVERSPQSLSASMMDRVLREPAQLAAETRGFATLEDARWRHDNRAFSTTDESSRPPADMPRQPSRDHFSERSSHRRALDANAVDQLLGDAEWRIAVQLGGLKWRCADRQTMRAVETVVLQPT